MTTGFLGGAFDFLINMGLLNTIVPFILFYAIVFGMLERTQLFTRGSDKKSDEQMRNLHALIAFAMAITATATSQAVGITQNYLPILSVTAVILLGIMMLVGMAFGDKFDEILSNKFYRGIMWSGALVLILGAVVVVGYHSGLLVTPCVGDDLTPVNSLSTSEGQCTQFIDITGLPDNMYLMGIEVFSLFSESVFQALVGIGILVLIIFIVMYVTKSTSK